jgi:FAD/FMN-containing dehydrogenase
MEAQQRIEFARAGHRRPACRTTSRQRLVTNGIDARRRRLIGGLAASPLAAGLAGCERRTGQEVTDVSQVDRTIVDRVLRPTSERDIARALADTRLPVSIGGGRYSMGGQTACPGSLHLDMRALRQLVKFDPANRRVRVQAGMRWRELQALIDPHDLSVAIMQSYSNFTVGGSVSVNCHGRYVGKGALVNSLRAVRLVTGEGEALELSRDSQPVLFAAVVGGYGGLGVITEVELDLDRNDRIAREAAFVPLETYPDWFHRRVLDSGDAVLHNADLSPPRFDRPLAITWRRSDAALTRVERLVPEHLDYGREQNLIWAASELPFGDSVRKKTLTRSQLHERPVVRRNLEASLDADALEPRTRRMSTYLLQEYFVPERHFADFARRLQRILVAHDTNVLNVSIRHASADRDTLLAWARQDAFSFVLYHKQRSTRSADRAATVWTRKLIDAVLACDGRYYLPYRPHATREQFLQAYPEAEAFAALKARIDPHGRFRNALWDRYLPR